MNSFTGIFHGLLPANRYFKEHLRLAASVQSFFFILEKLGVYLVMQVAYSPKKRCQEKIAFKKKKRKPKMLQLKDQELLLHYSPEPQQH